MRKWGFFKWTRDNQKRFADEVAAELDNKIPLNGGRIVGELTLELPPGTGGGTIFPLVLTGKYSETSQYRIWRIGITTFGSELYFRCGANNIIGISNGLGIFPAMPNSGLSLGYSRRPWERTYTTILNNGGDIEIPTKAGTMALVSDIEDILRKHGLIPPETTGQEEQS